MNINYCFVFYHSLIPYFEKPLKDNYFNGNNNYINPCICNSHSYFFSGFGLGTILTPVFMIFFPVDLAIALTGVVHFFNNVFKIILVGKNADRTVVLKFGIPAVLMAFVGALLLLYIPDSRPLFVYKILGKARLSNIS